MNNLTKRDNISIYPKIDRSNYTSTVELKTVVRTKYKRKWWCWIVSYKVSTYVLGKSNPLRDTDIENCYKKLITDCYNVIACGTPFKIKSNNGTRLLWIDEFQMSETERLTLIYNSESIV